VPRGISTNNAEEAKVFLASCDDGVIYKSNSGVRSIVRAVEDSDLDRLQALNVCPVFLQERVFGDDIRVHVIGNECHGVRIRSACVDYRYDRSGDVVEERCDIPTDLARRCIGVTASLGLTFSGIDFLESRSNGELFCLEVNPMPGYHGYDLTLDHEISASLVAHLGCRQQRSR